MTAPVEVLFVTTRATNLPAALERVPPASLTASISPYAQADVCAATLTLRLRASFCHSPGITRPAPEPSPHQTRYTGAIERSPIAFEAFEQPTTVGSEALGRPVAARDTTRSAPIRDVSG